MGHFSASGLLAEVNLNSLAVSPDYIGSDWSGQHYQADVVAVSWRDRAVLVGEAKWTQDAADRAMLTKLDDVATQVVERMKAALPKKDRDQPWQTHLMMFSRRGATPALRTALKARGARLVTFDDVVHDLARHAPRR